MKEQREIEFMLQVKRDALKNPVLPVEYKKNVENQIDVLKWVLDLEMEAENGHLQ